MDPTAKFWLILWLGITGTICATVIASTALVQARFRAGYEAAERLTRAGVDPIGIQCALWGHPNDVACIVRASKMEPPPPR